jgi:hypothetical protein
MRRSLVAGIVLVVALAACGSGAAQSSRVLVVGAADAAAHAKGARVTGQETITLQGRKRTIPIDGTIDFATGEAEMQIDASSMGLSGVGSIRAVVVDGVIYMDFGALLDRADTPAPLRGKKWLKLDTGQAGSDSGSGAASLLQSLRGAGEVREVGSETIDGVDTRHFHANVDTTKAVAKAKPGSLRDLAEKGLALMGPSYPVDVWIDGDGLPRRMALTITTNRLTLSETVDYRDYGVTVDVHAPPASDTADFSEVIRLAGSSNPV